MKKKSKIRRIILLLIVVSGMGTGAYFYLQHDEKPRDRLDLYGNVDIRQVQLAFHATGRIEKLSVQEGDMVKPGQISELNEAQTIWF